MTLGKRAYFLPLILTAILVAAFAGPAVAQDEEPDPTVAAIELGTVTEQDVKDHGITTGRTNGLSVVGVGTTVHLLGSGSAADGVTIDAYQWAITGGALTSGELNVQNTTFVPQDEGVYTASLVVTDSNGVQSEAATQRITSAKFVGISNCSMCHGGALPTLADKVSLWETTGHSSTLAEALDGDSSSHFGESCISCHSVGFHEMAENGGFDDVAAAAGWTFPETLEDGNWEAMQTEFPQVANLANVQCESCHGPGSLHNGNIDNIDVTIDSEMCGFCHDSLGYHTENYMWDTSNHASPTGYPTGDGRESCVPCHSGIGFVMSHDPDYAEEPISTEATPISCAVCHDPHSAENPHQIRVLEDVELGNGVIVTAEEAGAGVLCMNCHKSRRNVDEYVQEYHGHYGPHYGVQGDVVKGTGGYEYEGVAYTAFSPHLTVTEDSCVTCHMAASPEGAPDRAVGKHTFRITAHADTVEGQPEAIENTSACSGCHGEIDSVNYRAKGDYDGNGVREGIQDEVHGLIETLGTTLPPYGSPDVAVADTYTPEELKAAYNYKVAEEDSSGGVHNPKYTVQLLQSSYYAMTGNEVPGSDSLIEWTVPVGEWSLY